MTRSGTAHGKTPALPRSPRPSHRATPRVHNRRGALAIHGACRALSTAVTCAAAWARVGPRLCSARRGATRWCYTLEPPVGAQRCRHAPPARHHHEGRILGCYWCVREPQGAAALDGGWARQAAVVPGTACSGDSTRRARCWDGCRMVAQGSGVSTAAVSATRCRQKRVERCFAPHGARRLK